LARLHHRLLQLRQKGLPFDAGGTTGLLLQTLLETDLRVSEFTRLRVEDVSLAERVIIVLRGKGQNAGRFRSAGNWRRCSGFI